MADNQSLHIEDMIRQGYTVRVSGGQEVVIPTAFEALPLSHMHMRKPDFSRAVDMEVGPGETKKLYSTPIAGRFVEARVDPGHSKREQHLLHAKVKALQETLGISYKDAAHHLFMAEVERVKKADSAAKSFAVIQRSWDSVGTANILPPIEVIDKGKLDGYRWRDGKWVRELE